MLYVPQRLRAVDGKPRDPIKLATNYWLLRVKGWKVLFKKSTHLYCDDSVIEVRELRDFAKTVKVN